MRTFIMAHELARENLKRVIDNIPLDGKTKVEIKKVTSKRSEAQNKLYWMWIGLIAKELGYSTGDMHELVVQQFLPPEVKEVMGKVVTIWPSTKTLKVAEFSHLLNMVDIWASDDMGIILPKPRDEWEMAMADQWG